MTAIRHIVFDIGNVLIAWEPEIPYRRLIPDAAERRRFLTEICSPAWNLEQDRGRPWAEAEDALIDRHPEKAALIRAFRAHWHEMVPGPIDDTVAIFNTLLGQGHDLTLLTNFAADTFAEARARFGFLNRGRGVTVSGEIGLVKPDPAIFAHHEENFGLAGKATLFIDDNAANADAAQRAGWQAVRFTGAARLRRELATHGIAV